MTKVEELQVLISANADQFKNELVSVKKELQNLNKASGAVGAAAASGGGVFGAMFAAQIAATGVTKAFSFMTNTVKNASRSIIENGSTFSRLKIATDTVTRNLGLTTLEVDNLRDSLADANTYGTVAENVIRTLALSGLVELSKGLEAVDARTGETVEGVTALTLAMKDLAAANAIDSSVGIERIAKFIQRGETSFADGLIEIGEINREYAEYARQVGKSTETLSAQERAQVRLNVVMREGQKAFGAYANTYQTSGKAFGSIRDIIRNLTEIIGSQLEPVLRVGSNAFLTFLNGIRASLFQGQEAVGNFANRVAGFMVAIVRLVGRVLMMIPGVGQNFKNLANFSVKPIKAIENMSGGAGSLSDNLGRAADSTKKLKKELAGLASFDEMNILSKPDTGADVGTIGDLGGIGPITDGLELDDSSYQINEWANKFESKIKSLTGKIRAYWGQVKRFGSSIWDPISDKLKYFGAVAEPIISYLGELFSTRVGGAVRELRENLMGLFDDFGLNSSIFMEILRAIGEIIGFVIVGAVTVLIFTIELLIRSINNTITTVRTLLEWFTTAFNIAVIVVSELILWITDTRGQFDRLRNGASTALSIISKKVSELGSTLKASVRGRIDSIKGAFIGLGERVKGVFGTMKWVVKSAVNEMIGYVNRLINGLNRIKTPDWAGNKSINIAPIPHLAMGAHITGPTIAEIGEAGNEVVLPLEQNTGWAEKVASLLSQASPGGGGDDRPLVIKIGERDIYNGFIEYARDQSLATGRNILRI